MVWILPFRKPFQGMKLSFWNNVKQWNIEFLLTSLESWLRVYVSVLTDRNLFFSLSLVQSLSHVWLFATPWTAVCQTSLSISNSWSLLKLMPIGWWYRPTIPDSSVGKESACNAGDPGLIPGPGRSSGEGIGYPFQYSWASLVAQLVKNLPAMRETWVGSLDWEDPLEKETAIHSSILAWRIPWTL